MSTIKASPGGRLSLVFCKSEAQGDNLDARIWLMDEMFEAIAALKDYLIAPSSATFCLFMSEVIDAVVLCDLHDLRWNSVVRELSTTLNLKHVTVTSKDAITDEESNVRVWTVGNFSDEYTTLKAALLRVRQSKTFPQSFVHWKLKNHMKGRAPIEKYDLDYISQLIVVRILDGLDQFEEDGFDATMSGEMFEKLKQSGALNNEGGNHVS